MAATFTLSTPPPFLEGTTVKAYPVTNWPTPKLPSGTPIGNAKAEAEVSEGAAAFTGLDANTAYWAAAEIGGAYRYVRFSTAQGPVVTGARDEPEKALKNLLTVLDEAGIVTDETTET